MSNQQPNQPNQQNQDIDVVQDFEHLEQLEQHIIEFLIIQDRLRNQREQDELRLNALLSSLLGKSLDQITGELSDFDMHRWIVLLNFCHLLSSHRPSFDFTEQHWNCFNDIMMACPSEVFTQYLLSHRIECQIDILRRSDVLWTKYFVRLIQRGNLTRLIRILFEISETIGDDFYFNLILYLVREISNHDLDHALRESIFMFICSSQILVSRIVEHIYGRQRNFIQHLTNIYRWITEISGRNMFHYLPPWQPQAQAQAHRAVNAEAFIEGYFPSLHPLCNDREYKCAICLSNHDEPNDDKTMRIFRKFPCCHQHACHECLVGCVKTCNTFDPQSLINPDEFSCPCCRAKESFFS